MALEAHRSGLMGMDPPQHTQFRRLVQPGFTPRAVAAGELKAARQALAGLLLQAVVGGVLLR